MKKIILLFIGLFTVSFLPFLAGVHMLLGIGGILISISIFCFLVVIPIVSLIIINKTYKEMIKSIDKKILELERKENDLKELNRKAFSLKNSMMTN